jgi:DNA-binding transcriptional LysR family regulator
MRVLLPSLRGLEALTALAKQGSLAEAAKTLAVTRSALSHRIADLEAQLGVALVEKAGRKVRLTDDAEALLATVGDALDRIQAAVAPVQRKRLQLRVSTVGSFASCWLLPRLHEFRSKNAGIDISLTTTRRIINFESENCDCAIRHGLGEWPGLISTLLFRETLAPVAAPQAVHDLRGSTIIRARSRFRDWSRWWKSRGHRDSSATIGLMVETRAQALEAALSGSGIAMMDMAYAQPHIATGRLVALGPTVDLEEGYYLVHAMPRQNARLVRAFRTWIADAAHMESRS